MMGFDFGGFQDKYREQWERWYNRNVEGQAAGWANDPYKARNAYWDTSDFRKNYMRDLPGAQAQWYQANGWTQTPGHPGQWSLDTRGGIQQPGQQQMNPAFGKGLVNLATQLRADRAKIQPPAMPAKPVTGMKPPVELPVIPQDSRLLEGKGFAKLKHAARGTDRFAAINQLIKQYYG